MIDLFRSIKESMVEMRNNTNFDDARYEAMRDVIDLCDEGIMHFTDDGK